MDEAVLDRKYKHPQVIDQMFASQCHCSLCSGSGNTSASKALGFVPVTSSLPVDAMHNWFQKVPPFTLITPLFLISLLHLSCFYTDEARYCKLQALSARSTPISNSLPQFDSAL